MPKAIKVLNLHIFRDVFPMLSSSGSRIQMRSMIRGKRDHAMIWLPITVKCLTDLDKSRNMIPNGLDRFCIKRGGSMHGIVICLVRRSASKPHVIK